MRILDFLNSRNIGKSQSTGLDSRYWRPNLNDVLNRLSVQENDLYLSMGEASYVPPFACKFRKDKERDILAVANEEGEIMLYDTEGEKGLLKSFNAHHNAVFDICWFPERSHLVTVSGDHKACLWDINNTSQPIATFKNHMESIKSVDVCYNDPSLFATGSKDGTICVWDTRDKCLECGNCRDKPSIAIKNPHLRKQTNQTVRRKFQYNFNPAKCGVSAVAFQDNLNLASAGNFDGIIKIWDLRKTYISKPTYVPSPRYQMKYGKNGSENGCTSLVFDSIYKTLYGCSTDHKIYKFDCHAYSDPVVTYTGFRCRTFFVKMALSYDDQYLLCGSSDNAAYIWKTSDPGLPIFQLEGHSAEVTAVAWNSYNITKAVTCGDDNKILVWKTSSEDCMDSESNVVGKVRKIVYPKEITEHKEALVHAVEERAQISPATIDSSVQITPSPSTSRNSNSNTPAIKSIKSFFQPIPTRGTSTSSNAEVSKAEESSIASAVQVLSPSKSVNQSSSVSPNTSLRNSKSPKKRSLNSVFSKENNPRFSFGESSSSQLKRKSSPGESTPKLHKAAKKGRHSTQGVTKQSKSGSITHYFNRSPEE